MTAPIRLVATGDAIINRRISVLADADFRDLREMIRGADAALSNFETTTPRPPIVPSPAHGLLISSPAFVIDELNWMGFSLFNLANNHAVAFGWQAMVDTLTEFGSRGLAVAGGGHTLGEARAPAYVDAQHGRVALIGVTATNARSALAADPGRRTAGRPGVSPLRFDIEYALDPDRFERLVEIDEVTGVALARRTREAFNPPVRAADADALSFLGARFVRRDEPGVRGHLLDRDIASLERSIEEARRQADLVVVSVHCHEGEGGAWNSDLAPDFLVEAAHRCIDAGADMVAGHGPHRLRGIEIWAGKPIFYSLGNFFLQLETVDPVPPEALENLGLPGDGVPADFHDHTWMLGDGSPIGFAADPVWFETVAAECEFSDGGLASLVLHPVELGYGLPRPRRGTPRFVDARRGRQILERIAGLSRPYGTEFEIVPNGGRVVGRASLSA